MADESNGLFPVLAIEGGIEALHAACAALSALGLPRLIDIAALRADGPTYRRLREALSPTSVHVRGRSQWPIAHIPTQAEADSSTRPDLIPHNRNASSKKKASRYRRALERDLGVELAVRDRSDDPSVVNDFLNLQAAGWKGDVSQRGLAYQVTGRAPWLREVVERFRSKGQFSAFEIHAEGQPLYLCLCIRNGGTTYGLQDAYDETGARYNLGNLSRTAYLNWLAGKGANAFDPNLYWGYADSGRFYPDRQESLRLLLAPSDRVPRLQLAAIRGGQHLSSLVRPAHESATRLVRRMRREVDHATGGP